MNINIFKDKKMWENLEKYNTDIIDVYNKDGGKGSTYWFNPDTFKEHSWVRKRTVAGQSFIKDLEYSKYYNLFLTGGNYLSLFLINKLYSDNKNILIEDVCCGMGRLVFYLSKLGFNNFSMIDDFSQIREELFNAVMKKGNVNFVLNQKKTKPIVSNLVDYPWYVNPTPNEISPKDEVPDSSELFCFYCAPNIFVSIGKYLLENGYKELCMSQDLISVAYCKEEKYEEFKNKLKSYIIGE